MGTVHDDRAADEHFLAGLRASARQIRGAIEQSRDLIARSKVHLVWFDMIASKPVVSDIASSEDAVRVEANDLYHCPSLIFSPSSRTRERALPALEKERVCDRQRFVAWTFDDELTQIEATLGTFDRHQPTADVAEARKLIALLSVLNNAPELDAAFPRFLGHDMHWWVDCISLAGEGGEAWLAALGILAAVENWRADAHEWAARQSSTPSVRR